jgi:hypothetical protein
MHDQIYLFDISTAAKFFRDTPQNFDNLTGIGGEDTRDGLEVQQKPL